MICPECKYGVGRKGAPLNFHAFDTENTGVCFNLPISSKVMCKHVVYMEARP